MIILHLLFCFSLLQSGLAKCVVDDNHSLYNEHKMYHIEGKKEGMDKFMNFLLKNHEIPYHSKTEKGCHMLVAPHLVPIVEDFAKNEGLSTKVVINDYSELIRLEKNNERRKDGFSWTAYYDVDDIHKYLQNMSSQHSEMAQVVVGGQSYEGRQILGLRINTPSDVDKPIMFIESGIHAREWITPATTTYFINELLTSTDPEIVSLRNQFDWHIFPTVNPDGYHYTFTRDRLWRKTRSRSPNGCYGADPNRNWDYNWLNYSSSDNPCDYQVYAGSKPFSEIETRTLSEYISGLENMLGYISFHSDAQTLLLPYSDSVEHVDNYDDLKQIGETSLKYGYAVNQAKYDGPGTAAEILYKASGGSVDWVRNTQGTPLVYVYELRGRYFHWPARRIHEQGDEVTQMMVGLVYEAKNLGYF
ncbi:zinc carboxypeptidase-like isoform X1 [Helicoverpa zea]|uniref:zinc carboxypeptidase-like isoform X1 n=2 Tax=Helicoverpa zea TaxID=7113 RepID=UPI001F57AD27|nr:zinc carboxypeptidase-like isoform X1 [Helicoverpa zea]